MEKTWASMRGTRGIKEEDILEYDGKYMYKTKDGWFFIDETEADSYGPFGTLKECNKSMSDYAETI